LLIVAPGWIEEGRRIDTVASSVDILHTALSMLGVPYYNQGMGRDLLVERSTDEHFTYLDHGLLTDEFCVRAAPAGGGRLYSYRSEHPARDVSAEHPRVLSELLRLYAGCREWCTYMLYHNPPRSHPDGGARTP
jgi:hypothetical protein